MDKLVGVMGSGLIGTDPYAENAWSGITRFFFGECARQHVLHRAFGVEADPARRYALMLRNFSFDRDTWRQRFYLDPVYYEVLSKAIVRSLAADEAGLPLLQIGGIYNLKRRVGLSRAVYSYHDGNLAQAIKNPQFPAGVSRQRVDRALAYEKEVYQDLDLIFTMSDYLRRSFIEDFAVPPAKVRTIGAGVNLEQIPGPRYKDYEQKKILFVGADFERKGGQELLRAFKMVRSVFPDAQLFIAGPRDLKIPDGLEGGVVFLGFLSKNDVAQRQTLEQALSDATLFALPSLYEPFGIAPLEAMAYETPAVLSNGWAFPEMVTPGQTGELVRAGDADDLAEKLIHLLRDPDRLRQMGRNARQKVLERFTWESVVRRLRGELSMSEEP